MKHLNLERWVSQILATTEHELSCSECFDLISEYVDQENRRTALEPRMRALQQHLGQCRVCREEYEMLRELVQDPSVSSPGEMESRFNGLK